MSTAHHQPLCSHRCLSALPVFRSNNPCAYLPPRSMLTHTGTPIRVIRRVGPSVPQWPPTKRWIFSVANTRPGSGLGTTRNRLTQSTWRLNMSDHGAHGTVSWAEPCDCACFESHKRLGANALGYAGRALFKRTNGCLGWQIVAVLAFISPSC
jgi:hypothetical protein